MSFRYELKTTDGDDAGTLETAVPDWQVGDTFRTGDGRHLRIVLMNPIERIEEFHSRPLYGLWQVKPA